VKTGAVILSGGYSSRMNGFKPLMELGKKTLLERVVQLFIKSGIDNIVVVTGHRKKDVKEEATRLGIKSVFNKEYDTGMFSSVCAGVKQVKEMKEIDAFFILPVDIPLIRPTTLIELLKHTPEKGVCYPTFLGERGHPPLISAALIPAILKFNGKGGLKALLEKFPGKDVAVWDEGILRDADTPDDFALLEKRLLRMDVGSGLEAEVLAGLVMRKRGVDHGLEVAKIASSLGRALNRQNCKLDIDRLYNSGLLHDIAKGETHHEERGAEMLKDLGLKRLAGIVGAHRDAVVPKSGKISEKELVCLADKLVRGTTRMPVQQRFEEKLTLYAKDTDACKAIKKRLANAKRLERFVVDAVGRPIDNILNEE
jgi:molybdenum cofactor cytidylyltransferase